MPIAPLNHLPGVQAHLETFEKANGAKDPKASGQRRALASDL